MRYNMLGGAAGENFVVGTLKITFYYLFWLLELMPGHFRRYPFSGSGFNNTKYK